MSSFNSVDLSCEKKRYFYNYNMALAFIDKELPGGCGVTCKNQPRIKNCYMTHVNKRDGYIHWRILYGAIASSRRLIKKTIIILKHVYFVMN